MRTRRPIDPHKAMLRVLAMIGQRIGQPCPTRNDIRAWTGLPKREVWRFMDELHRRGVIEIEERATRPGKWRRMRIAGGAWTGWTSRRVRWRRFLTESREPTP